jgi:hypothetical protein
MLLAGCVRVLRVNLFSTVRLGRFVTRIDGRGVGRFCLACLLGKSILGNPLVHARLALFVVMNSLEAQFYARTGYHMRKECITLAQGWGLNPRAGPAGFLAHRPDIC